MAASVILDDLGYKTQTIEPVDYPIVRIEEDVRLVSINEILPFRVKFTAIQIQDASSMIPAIPFQVIGYSNYIL